MSPKRLVLFDIDGTLILGGPLWKESFLKGLSKYFPDFEFPLVQFDGKTDIQICREMMSLAGFNEDQISDSMHKIVDEYIRVAETCLETRQHEVKLLPGVVEILSALHNHPDVVLGLLTGNVKKGAEAKLKAVQIDHFFKVGVYGDDHWNRYELPEIAVKRVKEELGHKFQGKQIVIIGDTVHDVNCGKSIGVRSIAVGTGRGVLLEDLLAHNPDFYFKNMSETFEVLQAILEEL